MKQISLLIGLFTIVSCTSPIDKNEKLVNAICDTTSSDILQFPFSEYAVYHYDSTQKVNVLIYQYFNFFDIDNDGISDSILFIGNGGAHNYFNLKLKISTDTKWIYYPTFCIDMPYLNDSIDEITQFAVSDFDNDGVDEVYLNIDNPFGSIPEKLRSQGLNSKHIIIEFEKGNLKLRNFY